MDFLIALFNAASHLFKAALEVAATLAFAIVYTIPSGVQVVTGELRAQTTEIELSSPLSGRIAEVNIREGDFVAAGDLLIRFDTREDEGRLAFLEERLASLDGEISGLLSQAAVGAADASGPGRDGEVAVREQRITALRAEKVALDRQAQAKTYQIDGLKREIFSMMALVAEGVSSDLQVEPLNAELVFLGEELGRYQAEISRIDAEIAGLRMENIEFGRKVQNADLRARLDRLFAARDGVEEELASVKFDIAQLKIVAPFSGVVRSLNAGEAGSGVVSGQPLLSLAPEADDARFMGEAAFYRDDKSEERGACVVRIENLKTGATVENQRPLLAEHIAGGGTLPFQRRTISFSLTIDELEAVAAGRVGADPQPARIHIAPCGNRVPDASNEDGQSLRLGQKIES